MKTPAEAPPAARMLSTTLATAFFSLSAVLLLLVSSVETFSNFKVQETVLSGKQQFIAQDAAKTVSSFIHEHFSILETAVWLADPDAASETEQQRILQSLLGLRSAFRQVVLLNDGDRILAQSSRLSMAASGQLTGRLKDLLAGQDPHEKRRISPVYIDPVTNEPMAVMAVPVINVFGDFKGTLVAEVNLKFMWDMVDQLNVGKTGYVYVSDRKGMLLAFQDTARVLKGENVSHIKSIANFIQNHASVIPNRASRYPGILGSTVVGTYAPLQKPDWAVVAELPWKEAYREPIRGIAAAAGITLVLAILASIFGMFMARRLALPVINLTETATRIAAGEKDLQATVGGPREVARLAVAFNSMTAQLQQSLKELEERFADLKQTQEALRLSEERLRLALEGTSDGIWDWNLKTRQVYFSRRYYTMMGYEPGEFPPAYESWRQLLHPDDAQSSERAVQHAIEEHSPFAIEFRFKAKNGEWRWILGRGKVVESDKEGKAVRVAGSHTDITERKRAEEALHSSAEQYLAMTRTSMDGFAITDPSGRLVDVNEAYSHMIGYSRDELLKMSVLDIVAASTPDEIRKQHQKVMAGSDRFESRHRCKDGRIIDVEVSMTFIPRSRNVWIFIRDITERKQAEAKIRESEEKYRLLFDSAEVLASVYDREGVCQLMNRRVAALFGGEPEDFIGKSFTELHPKAGKEYIRRVRETIDSGISKGYDEEIDFPQGIRWLLSRLQPVPDAQGVFRTAQIISQDITERKEAEEALRREKHFSDTLIDGMPGIFYVFNEQGRFARWNKRFERISGYTAEEISRMHPTDFFVGKEKDHIARKIQEALTKGETEAEANFVAKGGRAIPHYFKGLRMFIGGESHVLGVGLDISDRKRAEEALEKRVVALTQPLDEAESINFEDLFNLVDIQRLQDEFASATGVASLITRTDGTPITQPSNFCRLCRDIIQQTDKGLSNCCKSNAMIGRSSTEGPIIQPCLSGGLWDACAMISVGGKHIANWGIGQVRDVTQTEEKIREYAREIQADEEAAVEAFREVPVMSQEQFERVAHVLFDLANQISTTAYQNVQQARFIAERKRAAAALKDEALRRRILVEQSRDGIVVLDQDGKVYEANQRAADMLGYSIEELGQLHVWDWDTQWTREQLLEMLRTVDAAGNHFETIHRRKDGTTYDVEISANGAVCAGQKLIFCVSRDVTERKKSEKALRESQERLGLALKGANLGAWDWNIQTGHLIFDERWAGMLGYRVYDLKPHISILENLLHPDDKDRVLKALKRHHDGKSQDYSVEFRLQSKSGAWIWILSCGKVVECGPSGEPIRMAGTHMDITQSKLAEEKNRQLESRLRQAYKMEAIGTLAGGIAHDFNNVLGIIVGNVELAADHILGSNPAHDNLKEVMQACLRAKDMVSRILAFSRREARDFSPIDVRSIVEGSLKMLRASIPTTIQIAQDLEDRPATILGDPTQIHQVVMNLCTNAAQAMEEMGSVLQVRLASVDLDEDAAKGIPDLGSGRYVRLTVSDTGHGIAPDIMDKIFDPYFTTKGVGQGTGMGLSVVHGIVKEHGGAITVYSEPGRGTTFHVFFPTLEQEVERQVDETETLPTGKEQILFVDDEGFLAKLGQRMLERLGYQVESKTSSIDALEAFRKNPNRYDLVVTDMTMPNMTGEVLAKELMQIRPDVAVILCTGFSHRIDEGKAMSMGIRGFVMKPFVRSELARIVRQVLDNR